MRLCRALPSAPRPRNEPRDLALLRFLITGVLLLGLTAQAALGTDYTWTGGSAANGNWTTSGNWNVGTNFPGFGAGDTATFTTTQGNWGTSANPVVLDADFGGAGTPSSGSNNDLTSLSITSSSSVTWNISGTKF